MYSQGLPFDNSAEWLNSFCDGVLRAGDIPQIEFLQSYFGWRIDIIAVFVDTAKAGIKDNLKKKTKLKKLSIQ